MSSSTTTGAGSGAVPRLSGATVGSAAVGAVVALPALRLRGLYLALATLAFAQGLDAAFFNNIDEKPFNGDRPVWTPMARIPKPANQEAYNRVDSLSGVVANLDNYKPLADASVNFAFDKAVLTTESRAQLDEFAAHLTNARFYILAVTGGTDSVGDRDYNYQLSQRRADAVVNYLSTKYNIPPRKFYLIGIGKDQEVASNSTAAGRAKNRRVEIKLMSNMSDQPTSASVRPSGQ